MERNNEAINYQQIWNFLKKYHTAFLLLFIIIITSFIHAQTYNLPNTENLARNQLEQGIKGQIRTQIQTEFPALPPQQTELAVQKQYETFLQTNNIEPYVQQQSQQFKNYFQNDQGQTYLLGIDPYHHYQLAEWQVNTGKQGIVIDGIVKNPLMRGRTNEVTVYWNLHSSVMTYSYKIGKLFNSELTLMQVSFIMPLLLMCLAGIVFYFIGQKIAGPIGGLITALISTNHQSIVSRTVAGFSDTDPYHLLFPGLAILCFLYSFNFTKWKSTLLLCLSGMIVSIHHTMWGGYWYTLVFMLASAGLLVMVDKKEFSHTLLTLFLSTITFSTLFCKLAGYSWSFGLTDTIKSLYKLPMDFINLKSVGTIDLWPNVMTTVAELNPSNLENVLRGVGFNLFFFAILGLFLSYTFIKMEWYDKEKSKHNLIISGLLTVWILAGMYASITSVRFVAILVPAIALSFVYGLPRFYKLLIKQDIIPKVGIWIVGIFIILLVTVPTLSDGLGMAKQELPLMNDDWDKSLTEISKGPQPSITTTYWDFGHIIKTVGKSSVTGDGGDQGRRIYWQGKILLSTNPEYAKATIRMLNCGGDHTPNWLEDYFQDTLKAVRVTDIIIMQTREDARQTLLNEGLNEEQTQRILNETFCEPWTQYLLLSEDLVGKAGAWGHYGSWDFERAKLYYDFKGKPNNGLIDDTLYFEIQKTPADQWIAGWPGYVSGWLPSNTTFNEQVMKEFAIIEDKKNDRIRVCSPELKDSLFTRLYLLDEQIPGFELLEEATTNGIKVYKVII